jgi:PBSX family phage portal protein
MENKNKPAVGVRIVKQQEPMEPYSVFYGDRTKKVEKSDKSEQLHIEEQYNSADWISHPVDMRGLKALVSNSTILPQCIRAYKNNIAGFGIGVKYSSDYDEETAEMKAEWDKLKSIIDLLNMDRMSKEIFESLIADRETYGISYAEVIRDMEGNVVQLEFIIDTPSVDMTCPLRPYVDVNYFYEGSVVTRKKKFRKYRQSVGGKTVYFKEFGDPRIMDKRNGKYWTEEDDEIDTDNQANELIEFSLGNMPYGEVRWIGQVLTVDGSRRAEILNNSYFRKGRHTPLMILVKGGTLSDESFEKLQLYMNEIEGESGQHSFLVLETDTVETSAAFTDEKQPEIEIKDMASILQKDELFQEYQENGRKKMQSAFLLPDLYVGYTTDFNRATAQTAMEVTEKQVFQPERESIAWTINNKLLNGYNFKYVEAYLMAPDITNPDDIQKILNITERAGGLTPNVAKEYTYEVMGKDGAEDYEGDWGDIPLAYSKTLSQSQQQDLGVNQLGNTQPVETPAEDENTKPQKQNKAGVTNGEMEQIDEQIEKASRTGEDEELLAVMKSIRSALSAYEIGGAAND